MRYNPRYNPREDLSFDDPADAVRVALEEAGYRPVVNSETGNLMIAFHIHGLSQELPMIISAVAQMSRDMPDFDAAMDATQTKVYRRYDDPEDETVVVEFINTKPRRRRR